MKKLSKLSLIAIASLMMIATACKKSPSSKIHNTWNLVSVEMPNADSVAVAAMLSEGVSYTFKKNGSYTYTIGSSTSTGKFEINKEGTSMTTTEGDKVSTYSVMLSDTDLTLSEGEDKMVFNVKK